MHIHNDTLSKLINAQVLRSLLNTPQLAYSELGNSPTHNPHTRYSITRYCASELSPIIQWRLSIA